MNQPIPTGPDLFGFSVDHLDKAKAVNGYDSPEQTYHQIHSGIRGEHALTAAVVMLTEVVARATGVRHPDLDSWRDKIGLSWLKECRSEDERPECEKGHTQDCAYTDTTPPLTALEDMRVRYTRGQKRPTGTIKDFERIDTGKLRIQVQWDFAELAWVDFGDVKVIDHELLAVGTRVLVSDPRDRNCGCSNAQPWVGKIAGYDMHHSKYQINEERYGSPGEYYNFVRWVFADSRVEIHPEGSECPERKEGAS
jgi:hypothetical protein